MNFERTKGLMTLESKARKASKLLTKPWLKSKVQLLKNKLEKLKNKQLSLTTRDKESQQQNGFIF